VRNETYTGLDDAYYWNTRKQAKKSEWSDFFSMLWHNR
jgi:hypothetical protein